MIHHLLYISEQSQPLQDQDLDRILEASRVNNKSLGLSGILIKNDRFFIQLLEGSKPVLMRLYEKIAKDPRHTKVKTLLTYDATDRIFPTWSMGFVDGKDDTLRMKELIPMIHEDILKHDHAKDRMISILKKFNHL